jgi:hypothetical protein
MDVFGAISVALEAVWTKATNAVAKPVPVTEWTIKPVVDPARRDPTVRSAVR